MQTVEMAKTEKMGLNLKFLQNSAFPLVHRL